ELHGNVAAPEVGRHRRRRPDRGRGGGCLSGAGGEVARLPRAAGGCAGAHTAGAHVARACDAVAARRRVVGEDAPRGGIARVGGAHVAVVADERRPGGAGAVLARLGAVAQVTVAAGRAVGREAVRRTRRRRAPAGFRHVAGARCGTAHRARSRELTTGRAAGPAVAGFTGLDVAVAALRGGGRRRRGGRRRGGRRRRRG